MAATNCILSFEMIRVIVSVFTAFVARGHSVPHFAFSAINAEIERVTDAVEFLTPSQLKQVDTSSTTSYIVYSSYTDKQCENKNGIYSASGSLFGMYVSSEV